ncbi:MAG: hypothetical protein HY361_02700 [Candidatus Aenigmarchaeota archaeon]|nr:hypothetical protein [Candidatus Aenigmarchaeota archaeon]
MKIDISAIQLSKQDVEKGLELPQFITEDLVYLCGFLAGDGCFSFRPKKYEYSITCVGHPKDEKSLYENVIVPLFKKLFKITVIPRLYDKGTTFGIRIYSKSLFLFFTRIMQMPYSYKSGKVIIPEIIRYDEGLVKYFIQGFADADFCLCLKRRYRKIPYYPTIIGVSKSKVIIQQISDFLKSKEIKFSLQLDAKRIDKRIIKGYTISSRVYISGRTQVDKWMSVIGFRSPKFLGIYSKIAGEGFEPSA